VNGAGEALDWFDRLCASVSLPRGKAPLRRRIFAALASLRAGRYDGSVPVVDVMSIRTIAVAPRETARVAILRMLEEGVGAVAVCDGPRLVGIFTERDVLRLAGEGADLDNVLVEDVMTRSVVSISPDDGIIAAAELMGERKIRHVPVVQDGNLLGMIGIRDVLGTLVEQLWRTHDETAHETARGLLKADRGSVSS
jgi:CBS domain-containing protein